jgi:hypothetical protein
MLFTDKTKHISHSILYTTTNEILSRFGARTKQRNHFGSWAETGAVIMSKIHKKTSK